VENVSFGKMNREISLVQTMLTKDAAGFSTSEDVVLASVRAYKEDRHGTKTWANRAAFSTATALFRFRAIPGVTVDTALQILCDGARYRILSAEDVRSRGMYIECLTERIVPSKG
jgi:head-tail adaptor